ncbi:MAG: thioredoxin [Candidatus Aenigmarchaeota archaeon]|nr:thioredoxin [Candidatus Aenigmarchaeota archaeon]
MTKEITEENFEAEVIKSKGLVLVDFWAPWCGPCRMLAPILEEVDKTGKVKVLKVNVDESQSIAALFGISSIPTLILFKDGKPISGRIGVMSFPQIMSWIESSLSE